MKCPNCNEEMEKKSDGIIKYNKCKICGFKTDAKWK